ncbi:MAG: hypothetical protein KDC87_02510, partial [Planctomycetes bacterium]|nr:hypothetical protein [Planctomycetota bacterium]
MQILDPKLVAFAALSSFLPAQSIVSPADRATLEGSSSTSYPLGRHDARHQQLHADLGAARTLRGHAYRRDALGGRGDIAAFKIWAEVQLSTTQLLPEKIDRTFSANVGGSPTTVLPKVWLDLPKTSAPTSIPGTFAYRIPYATTYAWGGSGTLCVDMTMHGNDTASGKNVNFVPSLDAQTLYASGRNLQPGYPFGQGCTAGGKSVAANAVFEVRHLGARLDLDIDSRNGVSSTTAAAAQSVLLLGPGTTNPPQIPWPPASGCTLYGNPTSVVFLKGANTQTGAWAGTIDIGLAAPPLFEMIGQILSNAPVTGEVVLSDASRLLCPPAGKGVVSARVISASDRTAATGST